MPTFRKPPRWQSGELYTFLWDIFPGHRTPLMRLDVARIAHEVDRSGETVYKWLRCGSFNMEAARALCRIANLQNNAEVLAEKGKKPPDINDFIPFIG